MSELSRKQYLEQHKRQQQSLKYINDNNKTRNDRREEFELEEEEVEGFDYEQEEGERDEIRDEEEEDENDDDDDDEDYDEELDDDDEDDDEEEPITVKCQSIETIAGRKELEQGNFRSSRASLRMISLLGGGGGGSARKQNQSRLQHDRSWTKDEPTLNLRHNKTSSWSLNYKTTRGSFDRSNETFVTNKEQELERDGGGGAVQRRITEAAAQSNELVDFSASSIFNDQNDDDETPPANRVEILCATNLAKLVERQQKIEDEQEEEQQERVRRKIAESIAGSQRGKDKNQDEAAKSDAAAADEEEDILIEIDLNREDDDEDDDEEVEEIEKRLCCGQSEHNRKEQEAEQYSNNMFTPYGPSFSSTTRHFVSHPSSASAASSSSSNMKRSHTHQHLYYQHHQHHDHRPHKQHHHKHPRVYGQVMCGSQQHLKGTSARECDMWNDDETHTRELQPPQQEKRNFCIDQQHQNQQQANGAIGMGAPIKLCFASKRMKEYFESFRGHTSERLQLYQFFKSVRTELVACLLFTLIISQSLITIRQSQWFSSSPSASSPTAAAHDKLTRHDVGERLQNYHHDQSFNARSPMANEHNQHLQHEQRANQLLVMDSGVDTNDQLWLWTQDRKENDDGGTLNQAEGSRPRLRLEGHLMSGLVSAFTVATLTQVFGHLSGCHLLPSISFALYVKGHITRARLLAYLFAQASGALLGVSMLGLLTSSQISPSEYNELLLSGSTSQLKEAQLAEWMKGGAADDDAVHSLLSSDVVKVVVGSTQSPATAAVEEASRTTSESRSSSKRKRRRRRSVSVTPLDLRQQPSKSSHKSMTGGEGGAAIKRAGLLFSTLKNASMSEEKSEAGAGGLAQSINLETTAATATEQPTMDEDKFNTRAATSTSLSSIMVPKLAPANEEFQASERILLSIERQHEEAKRARRLERGGSSIDAEPNLTSNLAADVDLKAAAAPQPLAPLTQQLWPINSNATPSPRELPPSRTYSKLGGGSNFATATTEVVMATAATGARGRKVVAHNQAAEKAATVLTAVNVADGEEQEATSSSSSLASSKQQPPTTIVGGGGRQVVEHEALRRGAEAVNEEQQRLQSSQVEASNGSSHQPSFSSELLLPPNDRSRVLEHASGITTTTTTTSQASSQQAAIGEQQQQRAQLPPSPPISSGQFSSPSTLATSDAQIIIQKQQQQQEQLVHMNRRLRRRKRNKQQQQQQQGSQSYLSSSTVNATIQTTPVPSSRFNPVKDVTLPSSKATAAATGGEDGDKGHKHFTGQHHQHHQVKAVEPTPPIQLQLDATAADSSSSSSASSYINLLALALPDEIMDSESIRQCINKQLLKVVANTIEAQRQQQQKLNRTLRESSSLLVARAANELARANCLSLSNSSQMFIFQLLSTLILVLTYLVNVDPRQTDHLATKSLSIGLCYFMAQTLTINSGGFYGNPFHLIWLSWFSNSDNQWRSEWLVYLVTPFVGGLFGAISHEYIDSSLFKNRNKLQQFHLRRSFCSLNNDNNNNGDLDQDDQQLQLEKQQLGGQLKAQASTTTTTTSENNCHKINLCHHHQQQQQQAQHRQHQLNKSSTTDSSLTASTSETTKLRPHEQLPSVASSDSGEPLSALLGKPSTTFERQECAAEQQQQQQQQQRHLRGEKESSSSSSNSLATSGQSVLRPPPSTANNLTTAAKRHQLDGGACSTSSHQHLHSRKQQQQQQESLGSVTSDGTLLAASNSAGRSTSTSICEDTTKAATVSAAAAPAAAQIELSSGTSHRGGGGFGYAPHGSAHSSGSTVPVAAGSRKLIPYSRQLKLEQRVLLAAAAEAARAAGASTSSGDDSNCGGGTTSMSSKRRTSFNKSELGMRSVIKQEEQEEHDYGAWQEEEDEEEGGGEGMGEQEALSSRMTEFAPRDLTTKGFDDELVDGRLQQQQHYQRQLQQVQRGHHQQQLELLNDNQSPGLMSRRRRSSSQSLATNEAEALERPRQPNSGVGPSSLFRYCSNFDSNFLISCASSSSSTQRLVKPPPPPPVPSSKPPLAPPPPSSLSIMGGISSSSSGRNGVSTSRCLLSGGSLYQRLHQHHHHHGEYSTNGSINNNNIIATTGFM